MGESKMGISEGRGRLCLMNSTVSVNTGGYLTCTISLLRGLRLFKKLMDRV